MLSAYHLLVEGRSGGRSVSEVCWAVPFAAALSSSHWVSLCISSSIVRSRSSSECVSRYAGRR